MRRFIVAATVAAIIAALAAPARAEIAPVPTGAVTSGHGRVENLRLYHPTHAGWYATLSVDLHFGYVGSGDQDADALRAAATIKHGPGTLRTQVDLLRVGYDGRPDLNVDDCRPAKGVAGVNSNNGLSPCDPLNSAADYNPDTTIINARSDWVKAHCTDPRVRSRVWVEVRFSDGKLVGYNRWSNFVDADTNDCSSPTPTQSADLEVTLDAANPPSPFAGESVAQAIRVVNNGPDVANGVVVVIDTDNRLANRTASVPGGICTNVDLDPTAAVNEGIRCELGALSNDEDAMISLHGDTTTTGTYSTSVRVTSTSGYADTDTTSATYVVRPIQPASPWQALDTTAPYTGGNTAQVPADESHVVDFRTVDLIWVNNSETDNDGGTSLETNNLGVLAGGCTVSVHYALSGGATADAGAVRLFAYDDPSLGGPGDRPSTAPDYMDAAPNGSTSGTLSFTVAAGDTLGYVGLVYDTSNGGVPGTVRFTDLTVCGHLVSFVSS